MINHFRSWLLNRSPDFFADSLWPVPLEASFRPSGPAEPVTRIDAVLFGPRPDASLLDYRFFEFLRIIDGSRLRDHVGRFDSRQAYFEEERSFLDGTLFNTSIRPGTGLVVTEGSGDGPEFVRRCFSVVCHPSRNVPITVFENGDRADPARLLRGSDMSGTLDSLGLTLTATQPGTWLVDYRNRLKRPVTRIVVDVLDLPATVFQQLFALIRDVAPEYEEGFRTITDSLSKFCMVLFAVAVANELMKDTIPRSRKRLAGGEAVDLPVNAEGSLYYGVHAAGSLRIGDVKKELACLSGVRDRRRTLELAVPSLAYVYLAWPTRFGLPAHLRIVVDGLLNSAWIVSHADDVDEQYTILRSEYKVRTMSPIRLEIL